MRDAPALPTELLDLQARVKQAAGRAGQKYHNRVVVVDGIKFDSKAEHKRYCYLKLLERHGDISDLRLQVPFLLIPRQVAPSGAKERACSYVADFVYSVGGKTVVEDVKGVVTAEYRIKRKLLLQVHGIEVKEIRA